MRLTLRTLLAYLDETLDPADADDVGLKIGQSQFATGLVQRIRNATRRTRLGVPALSGTSMGLHPNTVAEYLDNELPPDRVPDLEKICLESDVHLAEVAACHQVLTLILKHPAVINPKVTQRMSAIGSAIANADGVAARTTAPPATGNRHPVRHDGAHAVAGRRVAVAGSRVASVTPTKREPRVVPDYLRSGRRSQRKTLVLTVVLAFLGCALVVREIGALRTVHGAAKTSVDSGPLTIPMPRL